MPQLVCFLLVNWIAGSAIGLAAGLAFLEARGDLALLAREPLGAMLLLWAFAAAFGMGAIGTGLALAAGHDRWSRG